MTRGLHSPLNRKRAQQWGAISKAGKRADRREEAAMTPQERLVVGEELHRAAMELYASNPRRRQ